MGFSNPVQINLLNKYGIEILPLGVVVSLIAALILKRRSRKPSGALSS
jgi:hypothetical protein